MSNPLTSMVSGALHEPLRDFDATPLNASLHTSRFPTSSRLPGFYALPIAQRIAALDASSALSDGARGFLDAGGGLDLLQADRMSENVVAVHGLPFSVALNFRVNGRDVLIPMAVEEPSIVAAASHAALLARDAGGFFGEAMPSIMTTQVQLDDVPNAHQAAERILLARKALLEAGDEAIPGMVTRGGGCRDLNVRVLDASLGILVVHIDVDVGNAMGANLVDAVAEAVGERVHELAGGRLGLRILTNLPLKRLVRVQTRIRASTLGGLPTAEGITRASRFATLDPFRAVTHNKGILNGVDAAAVALGQDWRSIEAGAHAYASLSGTYRPLATWKLEGEVLHGVLEMPLAVGTVGGSVRAHRGIEVAFELVQVREAPELALILASAGLACNLAALKALSGEGIQKEHMRLHRRKLESREAREESDR